MMLGALGAPNVLLTAHLTLEEELHNAKTHLNIVALPRLRSKCHSNQHHYLRLLAANKEIQQTTTHHETSKCRLFHLGTMLAGVMGDTLLAGTT